MHGRLRKTRSDLAALGQTRFGRWVICEDRDLLLEGAGQAYKYADQAARDLEPFGRAPSLAPLITFKTARGGGER